MCIPPNSRRRRASRSGFTLLEILVVIAIIGMLVGLAVTNMDTLFGRGQESVTKIFVNDSIKTSLFRYRMDMGDFPSTSEGLEALVTAPSSKADRWRGPYVEAKGGKLPTDPYQESYVYRYPGTKNKGSYDVFSKGHDKIEGNEDDIGNW